MVRYYDDNILHWFSANVEKVRKGNSEVQANRVTLTEKYGEFQNEKR